MNFSYTDIMHRWVSITRWFTTLDWKNPRIILTAIAFGILPFIAKYYVMAGLLLGLMLAVVVLWALDKGPKFFKRACIRFPFIADIALSTLAVASVGSYFGSGLTLGLGALFCALILSWALTQLHINTKEYQVA